MICKNYKCKKPIPDGTKKCPHCGWEQNGRSKNKQPSITLTVSTPQKQEDGSFTVYTYAVARLEDGNLVQDGQRIVFHSDDLEEFVEETGDDESGRANHAFSIPASQAGENLTITAHSQIGNKRYEAIKTVSLPKEKEKPPIKKATAKNFFKTLKKYKEGGKQ